MKRVLIAVVALEAAALLALVFARVRADASGGVTLSAPDAGGAAGSPVVASAVRSTDGDHASRPSPVNDAPADDARAASPEPAADADDPLGIVLFGRVTDTSGAAVGAGGIYLANGRPGEEVSGDIKPDRGYCAIGLRPGRWRFTATSEGFAPSSQWLELTAMPRVRRLDLVLERTFLLKVKILAPDGQPMHELIRAAQQKRELDYTTDGLTAIASVEPLSLGPLPNPAVHRSQRETLGRWQAGHGSHDMKEMPREYAGAIALDRPPPCCVSAVLEHVVLATESVAAGADEVTLRVSLDDVLRQRATVRAQLVDAVTGAPLTGVQTSFYPSNMGGGGGIKSDDEGRIVFKDVVPGWRRLQVLDKDIERLARRVLVQPGRDLDLGAIRLSRGLGVEVQVVDARGNPAPAALNCSLLDAQRAGDFGENTTWSADADGKVTIKPAPRGRIRIRIQPRPGGLQGSVVVDTTNGPVTGVRLEARPSVPLRIVNDTIEERVWSVAVRSADDLPLGGVDLYFPEHELAVLPGPLVADIKKNGVVQRSVPLTVGERGATLRVP